ncbi:MAG: hypothetical protein ACYDIE_00030 [Candidatus Krumholzibacteriia bacterium]
MMSHRHRNAIAVFGAMLCLGCLFGGAARAGVDIDLRANVPIGDDSQLFFGISSQYFDRDRPEVERWGAECRDPDDLAVMLFLARRSGRPPAELLAWRHDGLTWWQIGLRLNVPIDTWFVDVSYNPGPPYGRAYGYWRHWHRDHRRTFVLTDREARDLVAVRMLHEYYRVDAPTAMKWRASGRDLRTLANREYRQRHDGGRPGGRAEGARRSDSRRPQQNDRHSRQEDTRGHGRDRDRSHR